MYVYQIYGILNSRKKEEEMNIGDFIHDTRDNETLLIVSNEFFFMNPFDDNIISIDEFDGIRDLCRLATAEEIQKYHKGE